MKAITLCRDKNPIYLSANIETQRESCRKFAKENDIEIVDEYAGQTWDANDASQYFSDILSEIKAVVKSGEIDALLVYSFYCIGRQDIETPIAIQALLKMGIEVLSVMEGSFT